MTTPNGTGNGTGSPVGVAGSRPVILVRYRPGRTGETARTVHLAPLPDGGAPGALTALCGMLLPPEDIEQVSVGEGMPCTLCAVSQVSALPPTDTPPDAATTVPGLDAGRPRPQRSTTDGAGRSRCAEIRCGWPWAPRRWH